MKKTEEMENQAALDGIKQLSKKMTQFAVIGLGRFGKTLALELTELGNEVLVIDNSPEHVHEIEGSVSEAVVADSTGTNVLYNLGVQNFDCVINCIGDDLEASVLTTLICQDLGVKYIVAKAQNEQHKKVLERIGADMVVVPEVYMGKKLASLLTNPSMNDVMSLTDSFKIVEIATPQFWHNKSILDLNVRKKYRVSIIFVRHEDQIIYPEPETILHKGDILIIAGEANRLELLTSKNKEVLDANHFLKDS